MKSRNLAAQQSTYFKGLIFWYFQLSTIYLVNYIVRVLSFYGAANRLEQTELLHSHYPTVPLAFETNRELQELHEDNCKVCKHKTPSILCSRV
jgi:hypothetical protein